MSQPTGAGWSAGSAAARAVRRSSGMRPTAFASSGTCRAARCSGTPSGFRTTAPPSWDGAFEAARAISRPTMRWCGPRPRDCRGSVSSRAEGEPAEEIQSEQSVVVAGHGALVVNNMPRNIPWYLPSRAKNLLISFLGSEPEYQPFGVQKFAWDPESRTLRNAWVNREVSSPSCVPVVSYPSDRVYLIGARDDKWTLEALEWSDGRSAFHSVIGGQRYNPFFSGT